MTDSADVLGKTILQLDPLTGEIDLANSYIEVHVVGQTSSQKVSLDQVGADGKSAYEVAVDAGYSGTQTQWLASLVGANGKSAYQSALDTGFVGTEAQFVASLQGAKGDKGDTGTKGDTGATGQSAYQAAVAAGFSGDINAWLTSLQGAKGDKGDTGNTGAAGADGHTIIATTGAPAAGVGNNGDLAFDAAASTIYGPKAAGAWPAGVVLKGAKGDTGNTGTAGTNGNTVLTTAGAPAAGTGVNGDFAYDPATFTFYGPKAAGVWPAGVVLKGAKGDTGNTGNTGATGNSAYQDAVAQGYGGTLTQWLASLVGAKGDTGTAGADGKSAYQVAVDGGFVGDEAAWLLSLHGTSAYQDAVTAGFVGDVNAWLASLKGAKGDKGDTGTAGTNAVLGHLVGSVATSADLPDVSGFEQADYFMVGTHIWMNLNGEWTDMGDFQGVPGQDGSGITVLGQLPSTDYLPVGAHRNGDAWLIGTVMYVWNGADWQLQGQQGLQGPVGPTGATGATGPSAWDVVRSQHPDIDTIDKFVTYITGPQGLKGDTAISFVADGTVATVGDLPATGTNNHGYLVGNDTDGYDFHVWINSQWVNLGNNVGPKGDTGAQGTTGPQGPAGKPMTAKGVLANTAALPSTSQQVGDTYSISGHFWTWDGAQFVDQGDFTGPAGAKGDKGDVGSPVNAKGSVANTGALPSTGNANGDAYEIGGFIYVYNSAMAQFVNMGQWRGTAGTNGTNGTDGKSAYELAQAAGFSGSQSEWLASLKGADGVSFTFLGSFANAAALPTGTHTGASATTQDTEHIYLWDATNGWVDNGPIGVQGPQGFKGDTGNTGAAGESAYQIAVDNGFVGDVTAWLTSLKGLNGDSAYTVAVGNGFVGTQAQWLASLVGPKGDKGDTGSQGEQGVKGDKGDTGNTGATGTSLAYIGDFANSGALPAGTLSQVATAGGHIFINNGTTWVDAGPVAQGPQGEKGDKGDTGNTGAAGESAYQVAVDSGFVGTEAQWLASLIGPTGASAVQDAIAAGKLSPGATINDYITLTTGPQGPEGEQGPVGDTGPAISIIGTVADEASLPATGVVGTGYAIPDSSTPGTYNCYIWLSATSQWFNLGHVVGAQGPKGDQGLRGLQGTVGPIGPTGATGTLWIVLQRNPQAQDGRVGDYFYNSNTQEFFTKTDTATWASLGHIGGGNLNAPAQTGKFQGYTDTGWANLPDVVNALPTDNGTYQLVNGAWKAMDTYTLKAMDVTITGGVGTVDLSLARIFRIQNTAATTINITNPPDASHGTTVVIKVYGKVGAFTWNLPSGSIRWFDGSAPPFTNSTTTIVLQWDGTEWVGSVPN
uniref:Tail fiber protein n=1 Tax=Burkholderia phage vB_BgluM-SURPRISE13 TaxID=3159457 RepID=A0AAU7PG89_9VIRU